MPALLRTVVVDPSLVVEKAHRAADLFGLTSAGAVAQVVIGGEQTDWHQHQRLDWFGA